MTVASFHQIEPNGVGRCIPYAVELFVVGFEAAFVIGWFCLTYESHITDFEFALYIRDMYPCIAYAFIKLPVEFKTPCVAVAYGNSGFARVF